MLNEAGFRPIVAAALIEKQLYKAIYGTAQAFSRMKLILFFFNEAIMYLISSAECLGGLIISFLHLTFSWRNSQIL